VEGPTISEGLAAATRVYQGLRLQMVITGKPSMASVSDLNKENMVTPGNKIQMWEVIAIEPTRIQLRYKDVDGKNTDVWLNQNAVPFNNKH
jgi:hypothetical protein